MSADNGIYILETRDGFRVAHLQAIDNIYWHPTCCDNPNIVEHDIQYNGEFDCDFYHDKCANCGLVDPEFKQQEQAYLPTVYNYFKDSKLYASREEAMCRADEIYTEITNDDFCGYVEYGIQFINGLEEFDFPAMEAK